MIRMKKANKQKRYDCGKMNDIIMCNSRLNTYRLFYWTFLVIENGFMQIQGQIFKIDGPQSFNKFIK